MKQNTKNAPAAVLILRAGETVLGWGVMAFSMFLSVKLMFNTLTSGIQGNLIFVFGFFGILLGIVIDSAKCFSLIYSVFFGGWKRVVFIIVFAASLFVSLVASFSELGRESYVTSVNSVEYRSLDEQIQRSQADAEQYRSEIDKTRYWNRKDRYQAKVDSIGIVISALRKNQKELIQEGAGETSFFNKSIRSVCNWVGIPITYRGANLVFGLILEIIGSVFLGHWAKVNEIRILNWMAMLQELISSEDSRTFIDQRLAAKQALVTSLRNARSSPVNAIDIDYEVENLDLRIAAKVAGLLQRGQHLPPTLQKKLNSIPDVNIPDPEAERILRELAELEAESKQLPRKIETKNESEIETKIEIIPDTFETIPDNFESETETETETIRKSKRPKSKQISVSGNGISEYLASLRLKAIDAKKLKASERFQIAKTLKNNGLSNAEIGRRLGITGQGVGRLLKAGKK